MSPYMQHLGIHTVEVGAGTAIVRAQVGEQHSNSFGMAHGGFLYSIADAAFELASNSHGVPSVALSVAMHYHRSVGVGSVVEAHARELYCGRSTAAYHIEVVEIKAVEVQAAQVLASFTGTVFRKHQP